MAVKTERERERERERETDRQTESMLRYDKTDYAWFCRLV